MKRIIIFAALAAIALTSCQQEITFEENKPEGLVFTATTEIPATKTELDGSLNVIWQAGDQIGIISNSYPGIYETETGGSTKASFSFKELTEATTAPFYAFYPTSLFTTSTFVLPATQSPATRCTRKAVRQTFPSKTFAASSSSTSALRKRERRSVKSSCPPIKG